MNDKERHLPSGKIVKIFFLRVGAGGGQRLLGFTKYQTLQLNSHFISYLEVYF